MTARRRLRLRRRPVTCEAIDADGVPCGTEVTVWFPPVIYLRLLEDLDEADMATGVSCPECGSVLMLTVGEARRAG